MRCQTQKPIVVSSQLEQRGYRRALLSLAVFRLRLVCPCAGVLRLRRACSRPLRAGALPVRRSLRHGIDRVALGEWQASLTGEPSCVRLGASTASRQIGWSIDSEDSAGEIPWTSFKRWRYMSGHYLLHVTSATFLAIPTACVGPDDIGPLEALFAEKIRKGPRGSLTRILGMG